MFKHILKFFLIVATALLLFGIAGIQIFLSYLMDGDTLVGYVWIAVFFLIAAFLTVPSALAIYGRGPLANPVSWRETLTLWALGIMLIAFIFFTFPVSENY